MQNHTLYAFCGFYMEIQQLDFDEGLSLDVLNVSDSTPKPVLHNEAIISSSSRSGWRRLKSETACLLPNFDPSRLNDKDTKITDEDLDDEIYDRTKSALANLRIPSLRDRSITKETAPSPVIQRIFDLVPPADQDTNAKKKEKIDLLEPANHIVAQNPAARKLPERDIEELRAENNTLVCAMGKSRGLMGKIGHKVAKFWKKHKKAILITAAVVAVAAAVVVIAVAAGGGAAAGAAAAGGAVGGAASSSQGSEEKPDSKPDPNQIPTPSTPIDTPTISYPFETFDPTAYPGKITFGESGVHFDNRFFSYDEILLTPPSNSWVTQHWLNSVDKFNAPPTFPHIPDGAISGQPIISDEGEHSSFDLNVLPYQIRGDWALSTGYCSQALEDFNKAIEMQPGDATSYLGRGAAHFELGQYDACIADYNQYTSIATKEFSLPDFSIGFAKGLPKGIYDSGEGMLMFLTDLVQHPIQTGSQVYESFTTLSSLVKSGEWETIGGALSPEVHELITQWETLPDSKKGELAGYAFGKHGADILLPGAAAKVVAKGSGAVKELGAVCKNLQSAEKVFVLEAVAEGGNAGIDVGEVITSAERALTAGEDLGLTVKQVAQLKQAGELEQVVGKGRDFFAGKPELQASYDLFKSAKEGLKPYIKAPMPEAQIRDLIHQQGIPTFAKPAGIPDNFLVRITEKGAGMEYVHPTRPKTSIRIMPGKRHSPNIAQQEPYVILTKDGKTYDKFGKIVPSDASEAHIPLCEFKYQD
jgi:hypothetical protein